METHLVHSIDSFIHQTCAQFDLGSEQDKIALKAYLSFWKWILRQDVKDLNQSLANLQILDIFRNQNELSITSMKAIRNILHWISYFDPIHRSLFQKFQVRESLRNIQGASFFEEEYEFLRLLLGSTGMDESLNSSMSFNEVFQKLWMVISLRTKCAKTQLELRHPDSKEKLIVHLDSYEVITKDSQIFSEPLSKALHLLSKNRLVFFEDFLFQCFGIPNYDPEIHSTKIRNLISRLKVMLPSSLNIKTKNERILSLGDWSVVHIQNQSEIQMILRQSLSWRWLLNELNEYQNLKKEFTKIDQKKMTELRSIQKKKKYTRREVEQLWGVSKATANRRIQKLLSQKKIRKWGDGRDIQYEFRIDSF